MSEYSRGINERQVRAVITIKRALEASRGQGLEVPMPEPAELLPVQRPGLADEVVTHFLPGLTIADPASLRQRLVEAYS